MRKGAMKTLSKAKSGRFHICAALACCFILPSAHLLTQESRQDSASVSPLIFQDIKLGLEDASSFFTAPVHFSGQEWLRSAALVGGTAALFTVDDRIQHDLSHQGSKSLNGDIWDVPTVYGSAYFAVSLSLATYTAGLLGENEELRTTGRLLGESLVLAGVPSTVVKIVAGRRRPYVGDGPWKFHAFQLSESSQSFPSGHATVAFAVSTVLAERSDNTWARIGLYGLASLTALARVHNNQHWFSDVVGGAGLGITAGLYVVSAEEQRSDRTRQAEHRFMIFPTPNGLTFSYRFD